MKRFLAALRRFKGDTSGVAIVEAVMILPVLVWAFIFFSIYTDAQRAKNLAQKGTYALADVISRETAKVTDVFVRNYARVFAYVTEYNGNISTMSWVSGPVVVRVTSISFTAGANPGDEATMNRMWSMSSDTARMPLHTNATIADIKSKIPALSGGDNIVVVETRLKWKPSFTAAMAEGLMGDRASSWFTDKEINTFTTVRPRFVPKVCYQGGTGNIACEL